MNDAIYQTFVRPQVGSALPVFSGSRRHLKGGGFFGTIARVAFPILKRLGRHALGAVSRGSNSYLSGNQKFIPAMRDGVIDEVMNVTGINKKSKTHKPKKRKRKSNF